MRSETKRHASSLSVIGYHMILFFWMCRTQVRIKVMTQKSVSIMDRRAVVWEWLGEVSYIHFLLQIIPEFWEFSDSRMYFQHYE